MTSHATPVDTTDPEAKDHSFQQENISHGVLRRSNGRHTFKSPDNEPKPSPKPVRDPYGYERGLSAMVLAMKEQWNTRDNMNDNDEKLEEAFNGFGVDLSEPVYARMMRDIILEGLTPMERLLKEE